MKKTERGRAREHENEEELRWSKIKTKERINKTKIKKRTLGNNGKGQEATSMCSPSQAVGTSFFLHNKQVEDTSNQHTTKQHKTALGPVFLGVSFSLTVRPHLFLDCFILITIMERLPNIDRRFSIEKIDKRIFCEYGMVVNHKHRNGKQIYTRG
jgi:hypothetical protein